VKVGTKKGKIAAALDQLFLFSSVLQQFYGAVIVAATAVTVQQRNDSDQL